MKREDAPEVVRLSIVHRRYAQTLYLVENALVAAQEVQPRKYEDDADKLEGEERQRLQWIARHDEPAYQGR